MSDWAVKLSIPNDAPASKWSYRRIDLTGQRFGKLTVLGLSHRDHRSLSWWACRCDCGDLCLASLANLRRFDNPTTRCKKCKNAARLTKSAKPDIIKPCLK